MEVAWKRHGSVMEVSCSAVDQDAPPGSGGGVDGGERSVDRQRAARVVREIELAVHECRHLPRQCERQLGRAAEHVRDPARAQLRLVLCGEVVGEVDVTCDVRHLTPRTQALEVIARHGGWCAVRGQSTRARGQSGWLSIAGRPVAGSEASRKLPPSSQPHGLPRPHGVDARVERACAGGRMLPAAHVESVSIDVERLQEALQLSERAIIMLFPRAACPKRGHRQRV
mmetsp:Transcript_21516/g.49422  ORF Transcript_21516/g.49422 Transcript_21516/m.49422 type:complete len:227 (+) Transcript_21516:2-682(+)